MGKKGSWFSAIKRILIPYYKEKPINEGEKKYKEKKKGKGLLSYGESKSIIPLFRAPSSIEKILGEADEQKLFISRPPILPGPPKPPPLVFPSASSPPKPASPRVASPKLPSSSKVAQGEISHRPEPTVANQHLSATKIQAAFRGFTARRSLRKVKGVARLKGVMKGQNVKRQITNAMKYSQMLVKVQTQIQSRRIQALENQAIQQHAYNPDKDLESSSFSKCTMTPSEAQQPEVWEDSVLTKKEMDERWRRKVEASMKRERAMAYACSHQLWKSTPKSAETAPMDVRHGGFPWWYKRLELDQLPPSESQVSKNTNLTLPWQSLEPKPSPRPSTSYSQYTFETPTPRSTRSAIPARTKHLHTPTNKTPPSMMLNSPSLSTHSKPRKGPPSLTLRALLKDDDSLTSCPPFSVVPNYMTPTASAKAKAKKRFSLPLMSPNIIGSSFKWKNGSDKGCSTPQSQRTLKKHSSRHSIGDLSVDSAISMPAAFGRKPFNRFV